MFCVTLGDSHPAQQALWLLYPLFIGTRTTLSASRRIYIVHLSISATPCLPSHYSSSSNTKYLTSLILLRGDIAASSNSGPFLGDLEHNAYQAYPRCWV